MKVGVPDGGSVPWFLIWYSILLSVCSSLFATSWFIPKYKRRTLALFSNSTPLKVTPLKVVVCAVGHTVDNSLL